MASKAWLEDNTGILFVQPCDILGDFYPHILSRIRGIYPCFHLCLMIVLCNTIKPLTLLKYLVQRVQ